MSRIPEQKYKPDWMTWPYVEETYETELGPITLTRKATTKEVVQGFWKWLNGLIVEVEDRP